MTPNFDASHRSITPPAREPTFDLSRPARFLKYLELRAVLETLLLVPSAPLLALRPRGKGRQVMVIPGYLTGDSSTLPLRSYLNVLGYDALPWALGRNNGSPERIHWFGTLLKEPCTRRAS
ncbi:MAG: hypothetical protein AB8G16_12920 [Gammaproteobacteria bacterium]